MPDGPRKRKDGKTYEYCRGCGQLLRVRSNGTDEDKEVSREFCSPGCSKEDRPRIWPRW